MVREKKAKRGAKSKPLTYPLAVRFEAEQLQQVDGYVDRLKAQVGANWRIRRTDAIRTLVAIGLRCVADGHPVRA